jgi:hypothetical protein
VAPKNNLDNHFCGFFLALSMSSPLEMLKRVNHGFAAQQIRPGTTRGGLSLLQQVRRPRGNADL